MVSGMNMAPLLSESHHGTFSLRFIHSPVRLPTWVLKGFHVGFTTERLITIINFQFCGEAEKFAQAVKKSKFRRCFLIRSGAVTISESKVKNTLEERQLTKSCLKTSTRHPTFLSKIANACKLIVLSEIAKMPELMPTTANKHVLFPY